MKLEQGMYVRTTTGEIHKIKSISDNYAEYENGFGVPLDLGEFIKKASYNIIDLIEVGDYVNGYQVYYCGFCDEDSTGLYINEHHARVWLNKTSQIKTIVTKEQFESMEYKVN